MISDKLLKACEKKNEKALKELYGLVYSDIMAICMRYQRCKQDAEEVHHDTFIKVVSQLKKRKKDKVFRAWVKRITINTNIDRLRLAKTSWHKKNLDSFELVYHNRGSDVINDEMDADYLLSIIGSLEPNQKGVFNLYAIDGYSHKEIAAMLEIAESSSRGLLHQARKEIQLKLKKSERGKQFKRAQS